MSEIRVNNVIADNGLDAVNFSKGINVSSGIITATTFSGSGASLTSLPAGNLTGSLPAISGASLTGMTPGITMLDQYYLSSTKTATAGEEVIMHNNFDRVSGNVTGAGHIGTGMTKGGIGIFTFPSTGIYYIHFRSNVALDSGSSANRYAQNLIEVTTNNSSYTLVSMGLDGIVSGSGERFGHPTAEFYFDVTNTSTHKCRFKIQSGNDAYKIYCPSSNRLDTVVTFMRIGDT